MHSICDVVVLTWNQQDIIKEFVESYLAHTRLPSRLIIIDNASNDGTRDYLRTLKDTGECTFTIVLNSENKGFVGGMNQGIALADAPYICLANNDLIFTGGWLFEIVKIFEKYPQAGVLNPNSNNIGNWPPQGMSVDEFSGILKRKYSGMFVEMTFCIGFCMVIRREVVRKIGGLSDEFYPMFFEDSDYSMKAKQAGYLVGVVRSSYVWHKEHASFKQWPKEKEEVFIRSRETFIKKWGRLLRIAWILNDSDQLHECLPDAISLARQASYVWFFVKGLSLEKDEVFIRDGFFSHGGVRCIPFRSSIGLLGRIIRKKRDKRFDIVITKSAFQRSICRLGAAKVYRTYKEDAIKSLKGGYRQPQDILP